MSDPAHPVQTDTLTSLPMLSPHESLSLNTKRGLLAAVLGNPATYPGSGVDLRRRARTAVTRCSTRLHWWPAFGHEGNFSPDGNTFYAPARRCKSLTAIDVTDPKHPHAIWQGNEYSHGLTLSDDGDRAYVADPIDGELMILDTSQIQARRPTRRSREISRLTWKTRHDPAERDPDDDPADSRYLLEFDEYAFRFNARRRPTRSARRGSSTSPTSSTRASSRTCGSQVDQPAAAPRRRRMTPGAIDPAQGYAAHYCTIPREVDPEIVACSFITSGLRVFDIRDPATPA